MSDSVFKLGLLKLGCIGAAPLLDLLLDERADREDLETRAFTGGAKLDSASCSASTDANPPNAGRNPQAHSSKSPI